MSVPDWYELALLSLASYRSFRLLAVDKILDKPRTWVLNRLDSEKWDEYVACPFCFGAPICLAWWGTWQAWPHFTLVVAALFSIWAAMAVFTAHLDP